MPRNALHKIRGELTPIDKNESQQRLDKWIWFARFLRNRAAAAALIKQGHVRVNGKRINTPGHFVRIGEVLTLALPTRTLVVTVEAFTPKRGDVQAAQKLYRVITPEPSHEKHTTHNTLISG